MFEREHHRRVAAILACLDADRLTEARCYFGGGTAIALRYGELRVSTDIDFLVSDRDGYAMLREQITVNGIDSLFKAPVPVVRGPIVDQYGIRTLVGAPDPIKFEIVREARIDFDTPSSSDQTCGVSSLSPADLVASKLLANDDRSADRALFSRDLIDLATIAPDAAVWRAGMTKACAAYGQTVPSKLVTSIDDALDRPGWLDECCVALQINRITPNELRCRLESVRELADTDRSRS